MNMVRVSPSGVFKKLVNPLLCFALIVFLLYAGKEVFEPLAFSGLFAILLVTPCRFFERQGFPRGIAALVTLLLGVLVFFIIFYFISSSILGFKKDLPMLMNNINNTLVALENWARQKFHLSPQKLSDLMDTAKNQVLPATSSLVNTAVTTITHTFFLSLLIIITTFLLLLYRSIVIRFFISLFAEEHTLQIYGIFSKTRVIIKGYLFGIFIEMIIVAVANCSAFLILGVNYAFFLGIVAALLNLIPYLGIFMATLLSVLVTFTTGGTEKIIAVIIVMISIHLLDSNILLPKVVGSKVKINALATIVGVIVGSALWGIPGTFLAVPMMAILKVIFEDIEALHPFAILIGEDTEAAANTKPMIRRIIYKVRGKDIKK